MSRSWVASVRLWAVGSLFASGVLDAAAKSKSGAPEWLSAVAAVETPVFAREANAVVLLEDSFRRVAPDGKITSTTRKVVRILRLDGRDHAAAHVSYSTDSEKITAFDAWVIAPDGRVRTYTRKEATDIAQNMDQVYTVSRLLLLSAATEVEAGAVFGCSFTVEEKSIFSQDVWYFQGSLPVMQSRVTYEVPPEWTLRGTMMNHAAIAPAVQGARYTWELRELPIVPDEAASPPALNLFATLAIDLRPSAKSPVRASWQIFDTWQDVSRYEAALHDPRAVPDAAIIAKTQELIAGAVTSWDKIKAIGRYVQKVNYAFIMLNAGSGGGHTPNQAAVIFKRYYGDCKDKTVLMRAMLRAAGINSYSAIAFLEEQRAIVEAWPSPFQFNHCIVAVAVDEAIDAPAVIQHAGLGRLLIYDPTNALAPPGELLAGQQGSHVLIGAGTEHDLVRLPQIAPEQNRLVQRLEARLDARGAIVATVTEHATGGFASSFAREFRGVTTSQYEQRIQGWIGQGARLAKVSRIDAQDRVTESGEFDLSVDFAAQNFAQSMGGQLLVFKPKVVPQRVNRALTEIKRTTPVVFSPSLFEESLDLELPAGFVVDELPAPVEITRSFGRFSLAGELKDGRLQFRRTMLLRAAEIPVEDYEEVRSFYEGINRAEQTPVVLKRQ